MKPANADSDGQANIALGDTVERGGEVGGRFGSLF